jgi:hypothetical protein
MQLVFLTAFWRMDFVPVTGAIHDVVTLGNCWKI